MVWSVSWRSSRVDERFLPSRLSNILLIGAPPSGHLAGLFVFPAYGRLQPNLRVAVVDIGSGSLALSLATVGDEGSISLLGEWALDTGLASFADDSRDRVLAGLKSFRHILRMQNTDTRLRAFVTSVLPEGADRDQFVKEAQTILDHPVDVLSPGEEAALSFLGSHDAHATPAGHLVVTAEIDGAATHLAIGDHEKLLDVFTIGLGAATLTDRFAGDAPSAQAGLALSEHLHELLNVAPLAEVIAGRPFDLVVSGAVVGVLAAVNAGRPPARGALHGTALDLESVFHWYQEILHVAPADLPDALGVSAARARTMLAGTGLVVFLMEKLGASQAYVSDNARRHGALREILGFTRAFL